MKRKSWRGASLLLITGFLLAGLPVAAANAASGYTSLELTASSGTVAWNGTVTLTATVIGDGTTPTGPVQFMLGDQVECSGTTTISATNNSTSCTVAGLENTPGLQIGVANYAGDGSDQPSSGSVTFSLLAAQTSTTLTTSSAISVGSSVTYTATVNAPGGGMPTGSVEFLDGGDPISACGTSGEVSLSVSGTSAQATCTFVNGYSMPGRHLISAVYLGSTAFAPSTAASVEVSVGSPVSIISTSTKLVVSAPDTAVGVDSYTDSAPLSLLAVVDDLGSDLNSIGGDVEE